MQSISIKEIKEIRHSQQQAVIINVLAEKEHRKEHIPGSINIPFTKEGDFSSQVEQAVPDKSHKVIVYCASSDCPSSEEAAKTLEDAGFENVADFEGGIKEWKEADEPVEKSI